jgi:quinol monooxygenase YgiN
MSVVFMLTMKASEGRYGELAEAIKAMLPDTAARPGAELIRAAGDPATGTVTVYEEWDSAESHKAYTAWRKARGEIGSFGQFLSEPLKLEQLTLLF